VIVTLGRHGACIADSTDRLTWIDAFRVKVVDSTAAGDAFNAGLAVALARGQSLHQAARFGSAVAAVAVTRAGAQPSMPSARQVSRLLGAAVR
jgi:ribokinase